MTSEEFIEDCNQCLADIYDLPDRAPDSYVESITNKVESMRDWAEENQHATERMIESLANIHDGVRRWLD